MSKWHMINEQSIGNLTVRLYEERPDLNEIGVEKCRANHDTFRRMRLKFCPECGKRLKSE